MDLSASNGGSTADKCAAEVGIGLCVCGHPSTHGQGSENEDLHLQIECDVCHVWYHAKCLGLGSVGVLAIDKCHCPKCQFMRGPSILRPITNSHRYDKTDPNASTLPKQIGTFDFIEELKARIMPLAGYDVVVTVSHGDHLTLPFLNQMGFSRPILAPNSEGLGLRMPDPSFHFEQVPLAAGDNDAQCDVIDVYSQDTLRMPLRDLCESFSIPKRKRESCLNCLSVEVSDSTLGQMIQPPSVATKLSWVNNVWPRLPQWEGGTSPRVQKYCIMSMENAYTDFHVDFGGTSVWYHVFKGEKVFYLIQPSSTNLSLYERWHRLSTRSEMFLGDMVDKCHKLVVSEGQTILIPTGWIHAVLTTKDSLVFGGNFLHSLNIQLQLRVHEMEERIRTPKKFQFPKFEEVNWLAAQKLKSDLSDLNGDSTPCPSHLLGGMKSLVRTLKSWLQDLGSRPCPPTVDPHKLVRDLNKEVRLAERIANKCNPPKPERESKRRKLKKSLNEDFIDISGKDAFARLKAIRSPIKKRAKLSSSNIEKSYLPKEKTKMKGPSDKKRTAMIPSLKNVKMRNSALKEEEEEELANQHSPITLKLPAKPLPVSSSDYDLTDRDSVRQLLSNRHNTILPRPKSSMKELNSALGDALAGFSDFEEEMEEEALAIDEKLPKYRKQLDTAGAGPLKLKLKMFGRFSDGNTASSKKKTSGSFGSRDDPITKVHQDEDYVYPSLDMSDDELDAGVGKIRVKDDSAWCPKAKVRGVTAAKGNRPSRNGARKVTAVEMGLKAAAERRKKSPNKLLPTPPPKNPTSRKSLLSSGSVLVPSSLSGNTDKGHQSGTSSCRAGGSSAKTKKGMSTAKQRLGKILKLKF